MPIRKILDEHSKLMDKAIEFLRTELKSVRTGRASPGLVDHLMVDYYGTPTPLKSLATVAAPDPQSLVIKPFDFGCLKDIEKAIKNSDLSLAPIVDGKMIRLNLPPMSEERRKQLAKQCKGEGETAKVSVRNARRDAIDGLKKSVKDGLAEDAQKGGEEKLQKIHDKYIKQIDDMLAAKDKEIMTV